MGPGVCVSTEPRGHSAEESALVFAYETVPEDGLDDTGRDETRPSIISVELGELQGRGFAEGNS